MREALCWSFVVPWWWTHKINFLTPVEEIITGDVVANVMDKVYNFDAGYIYQYEFLLGDH